MLWITSVQLPSFGRFRGEQFTFRPGMNLVCGKNEAGKSTILSAIAGAIFGFRRDKDRFVPWSGSGGCEARVSFAYDGREMTIARDFLTDRVQAVERSGDKNLWSFEGKVSPAGRSSEREEYLAKIEEVWGFAEGDIFRNSVFVGQRDLKIEGDGALTTRIKQLLSGFSEMDYDAVVNSLEKELYELTRRPGGRARDRELEEVRARMAELAETWRTASRNLEETGKIEAELAELQGTIDSGRADLEKGEKYLQRVKNTMRLRAGRRDSGRNSTVSGRNWRRWRPLKHNGWRLRKSSPPWGPWRNFPQGLTGLSRLTVLPASAWSSWKMRWPDCLRSPVMSARFPPGCSSLPFWHGERRFWPGSSCRRPPM